MQVLHRKPAWAAAACACLTLAGCGGEQGPRLYPVTGKVLNKGNPLTNCIVTFAPDDPSMPQSMATIAEDGSFELATPQGRKGAVAGAHKIVLSPPGPMPDEGDTPYGGMMGGSPGTGPQIPDEYLTAETSPKTVTVKADEENSFVIDVGEGGDP